MPEGSLQLGAFTANLTSFLDFLAIYMDPVVASAQMCVICCPYIREVSWFCHCIQRELLHCGQVIKLCTEGLKENASSGWQRLRKMKVKDWSTSGGKIKLLMRNLCFMRNLEEWLEINKNMGPRGTHAYSSEDLPHSLQFIFLYLASYVSTVHITSNVIIVMILSAFHETFFPAAMNIEQRKVPNVAILM